MQTQQLLIIGAIALAVVIGGIFLFNNGSGSSGTSEGDFGVIGEGVVRAWESWGPNGELQAIGITFDEEILYTLPENDEVVEMSLPRKFLSTPFRQITFEWNPHGHEPPGVYDVPHFDVHFYMISPEERASVTPGPDAVEVNPNHIPADYINTVNAVPNMGVHWVDAFAPEMNGQPFDQTFILGYYRGKMTFYEPMMTLDYVQSLKGAFTAEIRQPNDVQRHGKYYPTQYRLEYNERDEQYTIALEGMEKR